MFYIPSATPTAPPAPNTPILYQGTHNALKYSAENGLEDESQVS